MECLPEQETMEYIVKQLIAYGHSALAQSVADAGGIKVDMVPSSKLSELLLLGKERYDDDMDDDMGTRDTAEDDAMQSESDTHDRDHTFSHPILPSFTQFYYTSHKDPCRVAMFSNDGRLAATGSSDMSIKLLDVNKMKDQSRDAGDKPVIRTLYDHTGPVNDLSFHPNGCVLASCSDDTNVKLFDLTKTRGKHGFRYFQDVQPINSISFHPSGDYLLAATQDADIRIFDVQSYVQSKKCYTTKGQDKHSDSITQIRYSRSGSIFASSSVDGTVRIWDSTTSDCVRVISKAHQGAVVSSVRILKEEKQILTAGLDSTLRLWDISSGKLVREYQGHNNTTQVLQPAVSFDEQFFMIGDEGSPDVFCWSKNSNELVTRIRGRNGTIRCVAASPVDQGIITCSDDFRATFYNST